MENNKQNVRKGIIIACIISAALLLGFLGSYAYFISTGNNNKNQDVTLKTGKMALVFSDGTNGFNKKLNFGESAEKTFTIENVGSLEASANMNFNNLINTYKFTSLTYSLYFSETEDGEYQSIVSDRNIFTSETPSKQVLANNLNIPANTKYFYKLVIHLNYLEDIDQTEDLNAILSTNFNITEGTDNIVNKMIATAHPASEIPNFNQAAITDEGLFQTNDDYGTSYYYRGDVRNNYVKFGGFYWRIIRINGDGSLRIIYDGTEAHENGEYSEDRVAIKDVVFNSAYNDNKYAGYMFGGANGSLSTSYEEAIKNENDSSIKSVLDTWFEENIMSKNIEQYVSDNLFCNDRSLVSGPGYGLITNAKNTIWGSYERIDVVSTEKLYTPILTCPQDNDKFTVGKSGNHALTYPIGLITADEMLMAGSSSGISLNNKNYYLFKGTSYWTMTPSYSDYYNSTYIGIIMHHNYGALGSLSANYISGGGYDNNSTIYGKLAAVPVINLSREYIETMTGTGTIENPYKGIADL